MPSTNKTPNYDLPIFIASDKPAWLSDWNGTMTSIDTAIADASQQGASAEGKATTAQTTADNANATAQTALSNANKALTDVANAQTTADSAEMKADDNLTLINNIDANLTFKVLGVSPGVNTNYFNSNLVYSNKMGRLMWDTNTKTFEGLTGTDIQGFPSTKFYDLGTVKINVFNLEITGPSTPNTKFNIGFVYAIILQDGVPTGKNTFINIIAYWDGTFTHFGFQNDLSSYPQTNTMQMVTTFPYFLTGSLIDVKDQPLLFSNLNTVSAVNNVVTTS